MLSYWQDMSHVFLSNEQSSFHIRRLISHHEYLSGERYDVCRNVYESYIEWQSSEKSIRWWNLNYDSPNISIFKTQVMVLFILILLIIDFHQKLLTIKDPGFNISSEEPCYHRNKIISLHLDPVANELLWCFNSMYDLSILTSRVIKELKFPQGWTLSSG